VDSVSVKADTCKVDVAAAAGSVATTDFDNGADTALAEFCVLFVFFFIPWAFSPFSAFFEEEADVVFP
jgi:hypothetical protein